MMDTHMSYMTPIELRLNRHPNGGYTFFTIDRVWPGIGNVTFGGRRFLTSTDARKWARAEYPGVPLIPNA
jgi:hypothetical protein